MIDKELVAATSASLALSILSEADSYGYEMIQRVAELSDSELEWSEAMLYPVLHRLESQGLLTSYWESPPGGRRRKYYALTDAGRRKLEDKQRQWRIVADALGSLWTTTA